MEKHPEAQGPEKATEEKQLDEKELERKLKKDQKVKEKEEKKLKAKEKEAARLQKDKQDDRISKLPDHILLKILDQLDVLDVVRTSILARRWRLLPDMLSRLVIDVNHFLPMNVFQPSTNELVSANASVVEATKGILSGRKSTHTIDLIHVTFYLRDDDSISIGHAVEAIMVDHKVETTEFKILTGKLGIECTDDDLVDHGRQFMSLFNACPSSFGSLTLLHLEDLRFGELNVTNILSTCNRLRNLRFYNCDSGVGSLLQLVHSELHELTIDSCGFQKVELLWLPKLKKLIFDAWIYVQDPISFFCVPLLEVVSLGNTYHSWQKMIELSKFLGNISVRDLTLDFKSEKTWVQPEGPKILVPIFQKLCFVNLIDVPEGYDLTWTMFILDSAPNLKELYMTVWDHLCTMEMNEEKRRTYAYCENKNVEWKVSDFKHHSLSTLAIFNFQPEDYFVSFIRRVMVAAVNLEDLFLHKRVVCQMCKGKYPRQSWYPSTKRQIRSWRNRIAEGTGSLAMIHFSREVSADHDARMQRP